jgi:hypothetical protein
MTEKHPELKSRVVTDDTTIDRTMVDIASARADESAATPPSDPEPPAFDPGKFSRIEFSPEERKQMMQVKLPRLAQEFFQDTQPPNKGLQAPPPPEDEEPIAVIPKRRQTPAVVVVLFLFAALFVLALAIFRVFSGRSETPPTQTAAPVTANATDTATARVRSDLPPSPTEVSSALPVISSLPAAPTPSKTEDDRPPHVTATIHSKTPPTSKSTHSGLAPTPVDSWPPTVAPTASMPTAAPPSPAPARTSWFHQ